MRYTVTLLLTLAVCFTVQSLALIAAGGRTAKSESNFFSSIGRIQAGVQGKPEMMMLGSSITGRLPDRAQGFPGTANMGCDGGCAVDALRAMDKGILPIAPLLVIEANTLHMALDPKPREVSTAMERPWFKVGLRISNLSAYARPAAFLYSNLLERKIGGFELKPGEDLGVATKPASVTTPATVLTSDEEALVKELVAILDRFREKGSRAVIVWLPPARSDASPPEWILELARRSRSEWWDLGQQAAPGTVTLTDGVHMAASSAARTTVSLRNAILPTEGND